MNVAHGIPRQRTRYLDGMTPGRVVKAFGVRGRVRAFAAVTRHGGTKRRRVAALHKNSVVLFVLVARQCASTSVFRRLGATVGERFQPLMDTTKVRSQSARQTDVLFVEHSPALKRWAMFEEACQAGLPLHAGRLLSCPSILGRFYFAFSVVTRPPMRGWLGPVRGVWRFRRNLRVCRRMGRCVAWP